MKATDYSRKVQIPNQDRNTPVRCPEPGSGRSQGKKREARTHIHLSGPPGDTEPSSALEPAPGPCGRGRAAGRLLPVWVPHVQGEALEGSCTSFKPKRNEELKNFIVKDFHVTDPIIKSHFIFLFLKRHSVHFELSPSDLNCCNLFPMKEKV